MKVQTERIRSLNDKKAKPGRPVVYWMNRDQRAHDNWALLYAQELALQERVPLVVFFGLVPTFLGAAQRQYDFMLKGLAQVYKELAQLKIPLIIKPGVPDVELNRLCRELNAGCVVTDFSPLRLARQWRTQAAETLDVALFEVDAHNIVPCWHASPKQEFAAYTFRPKIHKLLPRFLVELPKVKANEITNFKVEAPDFAELRKTLKVDDSGGKIEWIEPGEKAAQKMLQHFLKEGLQRYNESRNDPNADAQSNLSPYLHFGQISAQRIALETTRLSAAQTAESFLEELVVRRELADNFCFYNPKYDSTEGFPDWAKRTLLEHAADKRPYLYSLEEFENANTHDDLWNAAQKEMVITGKMHGYMRMYWAKKILEWTPSVEVALQIAIELNDKYELDGRDPNGYCGIAWSIGGVHDRAWFDRAVYGKIRYMSYGGCKSKFDVDAYIKRIKSLPRD